jgi:putative transposase
MDQAEPDVLAYICFPTQHRAKLHSTDPHRAIQRRDQAPYRRRRHLPQRRTPSSASSAGLILLEQNDEWAVQRARYITRESIDATQR